MRLPRMDINMSWSTTKPKKNEEMKRIMEDIRRNASVWDSAYECWIDAIIPPEETRKAICRALSLMAINTPGPLG